jgi:hypothetical protein
MKELTMDQAIKLYGEAVLATLYIGLDQFNNRNKVIEYYNYYDFGRYGFDIAKKVKGDEEEEYITLFTEIPEYLLKIAKAIVEGKIYKAGNLCRKYNVALNISKLLNNNLLANEETKETVKLKEMFPIKF